MMIETIQALILDFQEAEMEVGVSRRLKIVAMKGKASVCVGVRRSGKSTYLFQIVKRLRKQGVSAQNILYLNFFDDRLHELRQGGLDRILEAYYSIFPEKKNRELVYCFFDEIQEVSGWEPFVDRLLRTEKCEVYLTGSSAKMLSQEVATQMRGRALSWEMFPFSFGEFLDYKKLSSSGALSTRNRLVIQKAFEEYWDSGGFPEVLGIDRRLRVKTHQEYFHAVLFRDLVERHNIAHPRAVFDLAHWLLNNTASLYSINNLTGYLKGLGHHAPKDAVADYLRWFEDAYFFFSVRVFDASVSRSRANPKKTYAIDHSLVRSTGSGVLANSGHLLESLVFVALRRVFSQIYYYRTKRGREVDFLVQSEDRTRMLVQVCESLALPQTRVRELLAIEEAMRELKIGEGFLVTRAESETIRLDAGTVQVLPAWRFLLDLENGGS
ncbi:MAG: ATP-binding protein [Verrucomicrobiae bacterium]